MRALMLLLLLGCGASMGKNEDLMFDVRTFQEGLRWRKYDMAANHVPAESREKFLEAHEDIDEDLRIDDYELEQVKIVDDGAIIRVKYTWHLDSVGSVHDTVCEQRWARQGKVWRIMSSARKRGEEMPRPVVVSEGPALP